MKNNDIPNLILDIPSSHMGNHVSIIRDFFSCATSETAYWEIMLITRNFNYLTDEFGTVAHDEDKILPPNSSVT